MSSARLIRALVLLCAFAVVSAPTLAADAAAAGKFVEVAATSATLAQLRKGGYTLYLRHGYTDNNRADRAPSVDLGDCSTQRPLAAAGREVAARVGAALRQARIPIDEIHVSPLCRARDTAASAFPKRTPIIDHDLMYTANLTRAQKGPIIANTRRLLSAPVMPGSNRLLIAHAPNLMDLIGYFPKEATLVVFRPQAGADGSGFDYVASIPPALWPELLR